MPWLDELVAVTHKRLGERELDALAARGVSEDQIEAYGVGYLDRDLPTVDYPKAFLEWSLHGAKLDDVYVFPLTNSVGVVRGVQFRHVERDRSGYSDYIEGKDEAVFFGLSQAMNTLWTMQSVYLVEGAFDLFPVQRVFPGVIATLTARAPDVLVRVLRRLVSHVWLGWDSDEPGRAAAERFRKRYGNEFVTRIIQYPRVPMVGTTKLSKDPSDLWEMWGDTRFQDFLQPLMRSVNEEWFHA